MTDESASQDGITRRQLLIGGAAAGLLAAAGIVGARSWRVRDAWYGLTGAYGAPGAFPARHDVIYVYDTLPSRILGRDVDYGVAWPPGERLPGRGLPLSFVLPGRGRGPRGMLQGDLRLGDFAAESVARGDAPPFALVAVDGGDTYWHRRVSGEDSMAMLLQELIPFCAHKYGGGPRGRKVVMGWSMGGYGAIRAAEVSPGTFCGVCAVSPALWGSFASGVGDAFDSAADYAANDVFAGSGRLSSPDPQTAGLAVRIDCGRQDPFYEATDAFVRALPFAPVGGFTPGGHDDAYWRRVAPTEMDFVGRALGG
jgi:S-formylglutathione hydrolase FrmB